MNRPKVATYYARLKVAHDAPPEVVRAAYKVLVQKYHPDRHPGSLRHEIVLASLNKAHEVLSDPVRRAAHDQWIRQEEIRLGWRQPTSPGQAGFGQRMEAVLSSVRDDGLPLSHALGLHLTRRQRAIFLLGAAGLLALLVSAGLRYLREEDDPFRRLTPLVPLAPLAPVTPGAEPLAYSASSPS